MAGLNPTVPAPNSQGGSSSVRRVRSLSDAVHTQTPSLSLNMESSTSRRSDVGAIASSSISIPAPVHTREYFSVTHTLLREPPSLPSPITPTHVPLPASPATPVPGSPWANMPTLGPLPEDDEPDTPVTPGGNLHDGGDVMGISLPRLRRILAFFGRGRSGSRKRRAMVSCIWTLSTGSIMLVVSIVLLVIAAHTKSKTVPGVSEWTACERPLGVWNVIWILKTVMSCWLAIWSWNIRTKSQSRGRSTPSSPAPADAERPNISGPTPFAPGTDIHGLGMGAVQIGTEPTPSRTRRGRRIQVPPLFSRLTMFNTLLGVTWFVTAHILVYTSLNTCRYSSPHLWWLTFGILCVVYLSIAEVILIAVGFFVLAPIVFITLNLVLLVLGRHPLQNPYQIKPTVGKLPKATVERIPLVMYIPSPPEPEANSKSEAGANGIQAPAVAFQYPPTHSTTEKGGKKRRFRFALLRRRKRKGSSNTGSSNEDDEDAEPTTWEGNWVRSELPYVRLEANRATCAICLMDFAEPPRVKGSRLPPLTNPEATEASASAGAGSEGEVKQVARGDETSYPVEGQVDVHQDGDHLHLTDAGEEAQPLRLLACGHAFHQTCLDPWLTDVSGRCPVCQRPVEVAPIPPKLRGGRWRRRNRPADVEAPPAD